MTDIEQKALALLNEVLTEKGFGDDCRYAFIQPENDAHQALCRAIERHEADKDAHATRLLAMHSRIAQAEEQLETYKQKVSDAAERAVEVIDIWSGDRDGSDFLQCFIIPKPKPDPLVEALDTIMWTVETSQMADEIRAALDALGFEIREKNDE